MRFHGICAKLAIEPRAEHNPKMWDNLKGQFVNHIPQVNADLKAHGLPPLTKE